MTEKDLQYLISLGIGIGFCYLMACIKSKKNSYYMERINLHRFNKRIVRTYNDTDLGCYDYFDPNQPGSAGIIGEGDERHGLSQLN
jgi:hypothetical protein